MSIKASTSKDPVLSTFKRLNDRVWLYTPLLVDRPSYTNKSDPTTILFFSWTGASPKHFTKYIQKYMDIFPFSRIVLATITMPEFLSPNEKHRQMVMVPVLEAVLSSMGSSEKKKRLLVHAFSNGAMKRLWSLITIYRLRTGAPFPVQLEVYDSCPGIAGRWLRDYYVLTRELPRNFFLTILFKFIGATITTGLWILFHLTPFWQSFYKQPRKDQNDERFISKSSRRLYIYSKEDKVIHWKDIESHADQWAEKGVAVEKVCVSGTAHCAHAKGEGWDEYWDLVLGAWNRSGSHVRVT